MRALLYSDISRQPVLAAMRPVSSSALPRTPAPPSINMAGSPAVNARAAAAMASAGARVGGAGARGVAGAAAPCQGGSGGGVKIVNGVGGDGAASHAPGATHPTAPRRVA